MVTNNNSLKGCTMPQLVKLEGVSPGPAHGMHFRAYSRSNFNRVRLFEEKQSKTILS